MHSPLFLIIVNCIIITIMQADIKSVYHQFSTNEIAVR